MSDSIEIPDISRVNAGNSTEPKRDLKGQWLPGVSGNTIGRKREAFTKTVLKALTAQEVHDLMRVMWQKGMEGDSKCAKIVFDIIIKNQKQEIAVEQKEEVTAVELESKLIERVKELEEEKKKAA